MDCVSDAFVEVDMASIGHISSIYEISSQDLKTGPLPFMVLTDCYIRQGHKLCKGPY